ncbi:MAG: type II toxin-antitoxin system RelE/ParE family toxin [Cyclobacteriaceae bacterium]
MFSYKLSEQAKDDLIEIWIDIFELTKNQEFADDFVDSFIPSFQKISKNPNIGESRDYLAPMLRKWTHRKYIIYYTEQQSFIRIERILWGRRTQRMK